jgi:hypothetical protein
MCCKGCTTYTGSSDTVRIDPTSSHRLAFACAAAKVSSPNSNTSSIPVHDVYNYITHDFAPGANAKFAALLTKNGVQGGGAEMRIQRWCRGEVEGNCAPTECKCWDSAVLCDSSNRFSSFFE